MDFSGWLVMVILPVMFVGITLIYYYMGRKNSDE